MKNQESAPVYPYTFVEIPSDWEDGFEPVHVVSIATYGANGPLAAGNMSMRYGQPDIPEINQTEAALNKLDPQEKEIILQVRRHTALERLSQYLESAGIEEHNVFILNPQNSWETEDLEATDVDDPAVGEEITIDGLRRDEAPADMIFTHNPEQVLAILPADCPTLIGRGHNRNTGEDVMWLQHAGWQALNAGYIDRGMLFVSETLGVNLDEAKFIIAAGAIEYEYAQQIDPRSDENTRFTHPRLLENLHFKKDDSGNDFIDAEGNYVFNIDMYGFLLDTLAECDVDVSKQVFIDNDDTARLDSGHSSHQRFASSRVPHELRQKAPMRDIVLAMRPEVLSEANKKSVAFINQKLQGEHLHGSDYEVNGL